MGLDEGDELDVVFCVADHHATEEVFAVEGEDVFLVAALAGPVGADLTRAEVIENIFGASNDAVGLQGCSRSCGASLPNPA